MPTYEYVCEKCKHHFEQIQPITSEALKTCPKDKCGQKTWGKGKVKRAVGGGSGLIFKGSGFYITDYRSDKYKAAAKSDAPPTPASSSSSGESKSTAGVTKPAATPAPKPAEKKSSGSAGSSSSS